jgi:hypothetical protein
MLTRHKFKSNGVMIESTDMAKAKRIDISPSWVVTFVASTYPALQAKAIIGRLDHPSRHRI